MKELRESESHINSLHRQLHTLSRMLTEARTLLEEKQNLLDVEEYLKKCEVSASAAGNYILIPHLSTL